jgi:hypothetical protein
MLSALDTEKWSAYCDDIISFGLGLNSGLCITQHALFLNTLRRFEKYICGRNISDRGNVCYRQCHAYVGKRSRLRCSDGNAFLGTRQKLVVLNRVARFLIFNIPKRGIMYQT